MTLAHLAQLIRHSKLLVSPAPSSQKTYHKKKSKILSRSQIICRHPRPRKMPPSCNCLGHENSNSVAASVYHSLGSLPQRRTNSCPELHKMPSDFINDTYEYEGYQDRTNRDYSSINFDLRPRLRLCQRLRHKQGLFFN